MWNLILRWFFKRQKKYIYNLRKSEKKDKRIQTIINFQHHHGSFKILWTCFTNFFFFWFLYKFQKRFFASVFHFSFYFGVFSDKYFHFIYYSRLNFCIKIRKKKCGRQFMFDLQSSSFMDNIFSLRFWFENWSLFVLSFAYRCFTDEYICGPLRVISDEVLLNLWCGYSLFKILVSHIWQYLKFCWSSCIHFIIF